MSTLSVDVSKVFVCFYFFDPCLKTEDQSLLAFFESAFRRNLFRPRVIDPVHRNEVGCPVLLVKSLILLIPSKHLIVSLRLLFHHQLFPSA